MGTPASVWSRAKPEAEPGLFRSVAERFCLWLRAGPAAGPNSGPLPGRRRMLYPACPAASLLKPLIFVGGSGNPPAGPDRPGDSVTGALGAPCVNPPEGSIPHGLTRKVINPDAFLIPRRLLRGGLIPWRDTFPADVPRWKITLTGLIPRSLGYGAD